MEPVKLPPLRSHLVSLRSHLVSRLAFHRQSASIMRRKSWDPSRAGELRCSQLAWTPPLMPSPMAMESDKEDTYDEQGAKKESCEKQTVNAEDGVAPATSAEQGSAPPPAMPGGKFFENKVECGGSGDYGFLAVGKALASGKDLAKSKVDPADLPEGRAQAELRMATSKKFTGNPAQYRSDRNCQGWGSDRRVWARGDCSGGADDDRGLCLLRLKPGVDHLRH